MAKKTKPESHEFYPMFMPASTMSRVSGLGENHLRRLMQAREIDYLEIGNHKLLCAQAVWEYYERQKTPAKPATKAHFDALYKRDSA